MPVSAASLADAFQLESVSLTLDQRSILDDVTLDFPRGQMTALVGHNGSGKSSLLRIMARQLGATSGQVRYDGRSVSAFGEREFARQVAYLPQDVSTGADVTVAELVAYGRYPWHGALGRFTDDDRSTVDAALALTHMGGLRDRQVGTLSGGERQRAWIAMLVAQDSKCLLLDEPTAALDIAHQLDVLSLLRRLASEHGLGVVVVLHDINMAARYCDTIHALKNGRVVASDAPDRVVTPAMLKAIYDIDMEVYAPPGQDRALAYAR